MARAVMRAFEEKRHLIVEAGTGTGKTLAYLVPAVAAALGGNGRVIVSRVRWRTGQLTAGEHNCTSSTLKFTIWSVVVEFRLI